MDVLFKYWRDISIILHEVPEVKNFFEVLLNNEKLVLPTFIDV
jgi:hypothetical protein